jgi:hypothetical protein
MVQLKGSWTAVITFVLQDRFKDHENLQSPAKGAWANAVFHRPAFAVAQPEPTLSRLQKKFHSDQEAFITGSYRKKLISVSWNLQLSTSIS